MKKFWLVAGLAGFTALTSCNNDAKKETVETDVTTVTGENVAEAQEDLNENVMDAQNAVNEAQKELDEAKAKGDQVLMVAAQKKLDDLQMQLDAVKKNAGEAIRQTNANMDGADKHLDNTGDAAANKLENVENTADKVKDKVK